MRELWGLLKAIFTDLTGGYRQRIFKNPEELTEWSFGELKEAYKAAQSLAELSEEQWREIYQGKSEKSAEDYTTSHSWPPPKNDLAKLRQGQGEDEELVQKGYEEVVEDDDSSEVDASGDSDFPELPAAPELSLDWAEDSEPEEAT